ncbi:MAG: LbtU family siderophore porin [Alphaproteobacteria bacterium]
MKLSILSSTVAMAIVTAATHPAIAADGVPGNAQLLQLIQQQQKAIEELKSALSTAQKTSEEAAMKADEAVTVKDAESEEAWWKRVKIGGVIEAEATSTSSFGNNDSSDLTLAKVELYFDANPVKYVNTHVQLLFEDGSNNITLDEAFVTLGDTGEFPAYLQVGQFAVPFGNFDTDMSTDPVTKDMAETKEAAALVGAEWGGFSLGGYVYNGDSQRSGNGDHINQGGLFAGYTGETGSVKYDFGAEYISNLADSDGLTDTLGATATTLNNYIPGASVHGSLGFGPATLRGAYIAALEDFDAAEIPFAANGARPGAWHIESAYTITLLGKETTFAATAQGTEEALALGLPEYRYGGAITVGIVEHVAVTAEYLHDEDYEISNGGTGEDAHTATLKLAVDF